MLGLRPRIVLFCLAFVLGGAPAWADEADGAGAERNRWIPSLTFDVLLHDQEEQGSIQTPLPDCSAKTLSEDATRCDPAGSMSRNSSSTTSMVQYRLGLDLVSPRLDFLSFIFSPRLWVFGGALFNPQQSHTVTDSPPGGQFVPYQPESQVNSYLPPPYVGTAAVIESSYTEMGWFVGTGTVFELPYRDSMFRLKLGVNYLRERVSISPGLVGVYTEDAPPTDSGECTTFVPKPDPLPPPCGIVRADLAAKRKSYHYLGPIGEVEMVLVPGERFSFSIYGQAQFLWNLDPSAVVMVSNDPVWRGGVKTDKIITSTFTYRPDDFAVRGAIGMRLSWRAGFGF